MTLPTPYYDRDGITIYCADCRDVLPLLPPVDLVLTDPPYQSLDVEVSVGSTTRLARLDELGGKRLASIEGRQWFDTLAPEVVVSIIELANSLLTENGASYVFADVKSGLILFPPLRPANVIVWDKQKLGMGYNWRRMHEWIAFMPNAKHKLRDQSRGDIIRCNGVAEKSHPTEKPVGVLQSIILNSTDPDALILDPFMGTGSSMAAASMTGRKAIGIEIEERYCEIAVKRLQQSVMKLGV